METVPGGLVRCWIQLMLLTALFARLSPVLGQGSQSGFLSLDCGIEEEYIDSITGITWSPDDSFISTGTTFQNLTAPDINTYPDNNRQMSSLRYFDTGRSKFCYILPVKPDTNYLLRTTFFPGTLNDNSRTFYFHLYLNNTIFADYLFQAGEARTLVNTYTVIFHSPGTKADFCLAPVTETNPAAFLSALELRELDRGMYSKTVGPSSDFLLVQARRINFGPRPGIASLRYPYDGYDRFWSTQDSNATLISNRNISSSTGSRAPDLPPRAVMEDGAVYYGFDYWQFTFQLAIYYNGYLYAALYFQELDNNASATNVRGMDFYLNDAFVASFNSSAEPLEITSPTQYYSTAILNVSIHQASWSRLPPVVNAMEIYALVNVSYATTASEDVIALAALQQRLNLTSWDTDPCLPVSYNYIDCNNYTSPRITRLLLQNMGITGTIPEEIMNLTALTGIQLQNNNLTGDIPSFLVAMPRLMYLNLDNNSLTGSVPKDLATKLGSNFTVLNNPGLKCNVAACGSTGSKSKSKVGAAVGGTIVGVAVLVILTWIAWYMWTRKRRARSKVLKDIAKAEAQIQADSPMAKQLLQGSVRVLSLKEVSDATKRFSRRLGEGSFGPVYHGTLSDGQEVAVKVKAGESRQGFTQFLNEVTLLSRIHHRNLISLVACCEEGNQQILLYAFAPNGNLREHLYSDKENIIPMSWKTRLDIALNSARGLEYLHTDCKPRIIHRDVKSSNILLDENLLAKVADFGISKQTPEGVDFTSIDTLLRGTPGYFDPEYFITQRLTQKSDVYSFGVMLLEIISGQHPHVREFADGTVGTLVQWVHMSVRAGKTMDIVDPKLEGEYNHESMMMVISLALDSISLDTLQRPDMNQVVRTLGDAINLERSGSSEIFNKPSDHHNANTKISEENESSEPGTGDFTIGSTEFSLTLSTP